MTPREVSRELRDCILLVALAVAIAVALPAVACPDEVIPLDGKTICPAGHRYEPLRLAGPRWVGFCYKGDVDVALARVCSARGDCDRLPGAETLSAACDRIPSGGYFPCDTEECVLREIRDELRLMNDVRTYRYLRGIR